ncbi:Hypothetical predicted protein [Pelobates cultripes]|uniref:Uncharacterized protein n=1 Tax=Pelobates cultripes TaxID=61616 RepID=A0AAD1SI11_PELCU|nr:Hypothetical predicted protein [Pelobates cultripes]
MASNGDLDLTEIRGLRGSPGYFKKGKLLSIDEVSACLEFKEHLNDARENMKFYISNVKTDQFFKLNIEFPITKLRHVTTEDCMRCIVQEQYIGIGNNIKPEPLKDLSCWSAEFPPKEELPYEQAFEKVQRIVPTWDAEPFQEEIKDQFASSPAFDNSSSRYGNFVFSFPLSDLLKAYKSQHCQNGDPQLKVLGTAMYSQEIAHMVIVHSPDTDRYDKLPMVQTVSSTAESLPFFYRKEEDGELYWRPESTSGGLRVTISEGGEIYTCPLNKTRTGKFCVWNHLIVAFHLPDSKYLVIPEKQLLENLSACEPAMPYLKDPRTNLSKAEAEEIIKELKNSQ